MAEPKNEKRLRFVKHAVYNGEVVHKEGEVKVLANDLGMADRWIKRGVAIEVSEEKKEAVKPKSKAELEAEAKAKADAEAAEKAKAEDELKKVANGAAPANNKVKDDL